MNRKMILPALGVLALAACATAEDGLLEQGIAPLTPSETQAFVSGKTICGTTARGDNACTYFAANGVAIAKNMDRGAPNAGTYKVDEAGRLCLNWTYDTNWPSACSKAYPLQGGGYSMVAPNGMVSFSVKEILSGNPKNLSNPAS